LTDKLSRVIYMVCKRSPYLNSPLDCCSHACVAPIASRWWVDDSLAIEGIEGQL
jgi:hypothetical protein